MAALNQSLIIFPLLLTVGLFLQYSSSHQIALDFHHEFWVAGSRVLHGLSPYDWTRHQLASAVGFGYPAPAALLFVPFSLLPRGLSDLLFVALSVAACLAALRILNVRDWRLYTLVLLWWPVINAWQTANVTLLLVCGLAALWRYRDSPVTAGVLAALMLCLKPIVWPLVLWLLITRRFRAAAYALAIALLLNAVAWLVLGFGEINAWIHILSVQTDLFSRQGYGLIALAMRLLGADRTDGTVLQALVTTALTIACFQLARTRQDRQAFALTVTLIIVASPLVDNHYLALLIVPLAIARPYLSRAWLPPLLFWLCPATGFAVWQLALAWVLVSAITVWLIRADQPSGTQRRSPRTRTVAPETVMPDQRDATLNHASTALGLLQAQR